LGRADPASGMSEVERAQYKSYKELKQRIERERQLAVVQVKVGDLSTHKLSVQKITNSTVHSKDYLIFAIT
jgi:hypothetical protein